MHAAMYASTCLGLDQVQKGIDTALRRGFHLRHIRQHDIQRHVCQHETHSMPQSPYLDGTATNGADSLAHKVDIHLGGVLLQLGQDLR